MSAAMDNLERYQISKMPPTAYYIPDYITAEEERFLLKEVDASPKPKWTQLSHRRLQNWGGLPHPKGMVPEKLPEWLDVYVKKVAELGIFHEKRPNHVLVNDYLPGEGIMPHEDGPLFHPVITTINLGSHTLLDYYRQVEKSDSCNTDQEATSLEDRYIGSVLLQPRSLLVVKDDLYHNYLHGIREVTEDHVTDRVFNRLVETSNCGDVTLPRERRISLTIRHVPKTLNVRLKIGR